MAFKGHYMLASAINSIFVWITTTWFNNLVMEIFPTWNASGVIIFVPYHNTLILKLNYIINYAFIIFRINLLTILWPTCLVSKN